MGAERAAWMMIRSRNRGAHARRQRASEFSSGSKSSASQIPPGPKYCGDVCPAQNCFPRYKNDVFVLMVRVWATRERKYRGAFCARCLFYQPAAKSNIWIRRQISWRRSSLAALKLSISITANGYWCSAAGSSPAAPQTRLFALSLGLFRRKTTQVGLKIVSEEFISRRKRAMQFLGSSMRATKWNLIS